MPRQPPESTLFPYTTLFRSSRLPDMIICTALPVRPFARSKTAYYIAAPIHRRPGDRAASHPRPRSHRSEEHTSELQSRRDLVCRLLLEKKNFQVEKPGFNSN